MKNHIAIILLSFVFLWSCQEDNAKKNEKKGDRLISQVIKKSGGEILETGIVKFNFRGNEYISIRNCGMFELHKTHITKVRDTVKDLLDNQGFTRRVNGQPIKVVDSMAKKYESSLNSVHYFAYLPFGLSDPAVLKAYVGEEEIKKQVYDKVKVTFTQKGGGEDHEDVYYYWINQNTQVIDYLAYSYHIDGGGMRFRKAYNAQKVNGVRFVDYKNYKPKAAIVLEDIGKAFNENKLQLVSDIKLENIQVYKRDLACH